MPIIRSTPKKDQPLKVVSIHTAAKVAGQVVSTSQNGRRVVVRLTEGCRKGVELAFFRGRVKPAAYRSSSNETLFSLA